MCKVHLRRVEWDVWKFPVRLYPYVDATQHTARRPIAIDPLVAFGRPIVQRVGIPSTDGLIRQVNLVSLVDSHSHDGLDVPRTGEDLKRVKKIVREKSVEDIERQFVQAALERHDSNVTRAAEAAGMQRTNFHALMRKYGIRVRDTEGDAGDAPSDLDPDAR